MAALTWLSLISVAHGQTYTTITGTWTDDLSLSDPGWEEHAQGIVSLFNHDCHGYYHGGGGGVSGSFSTRENFYISRQFYCGPFDASLEITYKLYYCGCDGNDFVQVSINDEAVDQTTYTSGGQYAGYDASTYQCGYYWYARSPESMLFPLVEHGSPFEIVFLISLNMAVERISLCDIEITCHPLTDPPTTQVPTGPPVSLRVLTGLYTCTCLPRIAERASFREFDRVSHAAPDSSACDWRPHHSSTDFIPFECTHPPFNKGADSYANQATNSTPIVFANGASAE